MSEWKLVPVEPTEMMIYAVRRYDAAFDWQGTEEFARGAWARCLDAALPPPSQWPQPRPMSEAPKSVESWPPNKVLAWWPAEKDWVTTWWWCARSMWIHALSETDEQQPTHWLPLPAAPAEQEVTK
jgi:hypothetical protein